MRLHFRSSIWWLGAAATASLALGAGIVRATIPDTARAGTRPPTPLETIAYSRCTARQRNSCTATALYTVAADGSRRRLLVPNASSPTWSPGGLSPAWSPDGRQIAYSGRGGIWVVRADGTGRRRLTTNPREGLDSGPSWSPDGQRITFQRERYVGDTLVSDLYAVEIQTRRFTRLTRTPEIMEFDAAWSPDGKEIAYQQEYGRDGIHVLDLATGRSERLTSGSGDSEPAWSPDGTKIAFAIFGGARPGAIVVMKRDGSRRRKIVASARPWRWFWSPSWSPDGSRIAYGSAVRDGPHWIVVTRADGKGRLILVRGDEPDWRPHLPRS
jgi:dipeptidyl aminopeptidase/acylaminoacyl peptidase